jgi:hypothetical protein
MSDTKKLVRFLASPATDGDPQLILEMADGSRLTLTATFEQIEDMADVLDELLDGPGSIEDGGLDQLPEFVRKGGNPTS